MNTGATDPTTAPSQQPDEAARLAVLHSLRIVSTGSEPAIDGAARLASRLLDCPIALVSLVDQDIQWFKARVGLEVCSTPREQSFCAHALPLPGHDVLVVEDASRDPRFADNPLVTGEPHIRFYAGALLTSSDGFNLGTLCVIDTLPRLRPSAAELDDLRHLARLVVSEFEHARAERVRLEQQRMLSISEGLSGVGTWRLDLATQKVNWSDEVYRIHGVRPEDFDPDHDSAIDFYHPDDKPILSALLGDTIAGKGPFEFELRILRADGQERVVVSKGACEFNAQGQALTLLGVFQDVTDQRAATARIERERVRYKLLADNVADVIARVKLDGSSNYISPAVEKLLGYTPAEMTGQASTAFVHPEDRPLIGRALKALADGEGETSVEHRVVHRDGHPIWVETRFCMVRDEAGAPLESVVVIRDIAHRKQLEDDLKQARAAAEAAATVKGEFLANMSHELRTPLTSIIGFTGLAAQQADMPELARDYVSRVENAGRALLCTVNDILDFSKLEAGQVAIRPEPVDIAELCRKTLDLFTPQAGAKDLDLVLEIEDDCGSLMVDPDRIRQLLLNLVGNAVKFTAAGTVTLSVRRDPATGQLRVEIRDTGAGISADKLDRLFQRFSQIDGSLTRSHGGTGLGLAICKGLVEAMGGQIGADSHVGTGSTFWFAIPAPVAAPAATSPTAFHPALAAGLAGLRVLVADDHPANRELARLFLSGVGAEVSEAVDGETAVTLADQQPFDVILMDMRMPRLDGPGALAAIRSGGGPNDATPILAYTADASDDEIVRIIARGFDGVVAKPVASAALVEAVANAIHIVLPCGDISHVG